ncbi:DUF2306 domain-containing protein [Pseudonocardia endophytica]|nr:DUF2306 domain-containing protein [Pseudonocardia endophytica]
MTPTEPAPPGFRSARGWTWPVVIMGVVAVGATIALVVPYVGLDVDASRIPTTSTLHYALLVAHIVTASVALVLGPLQFVPAVRARRAVHRVIGRCYLLVGVVPSALVGIPVAILSGRLLTQVGLTIPFLGWLVTAWLAVRAIRGGDVVAHHEWMMRNYALTFLAITARVLVPVMLVVQIPFSDGADPAAGVSSLIPVGQVLAWIVNLTIVEVLIRRRRVRAGLPARAAV